MPSIAVSTSPGRGFGHLFADDMIDAFVRIIGLGNSMEGAKVLNLAADPSPTWLELFHFLLNSWDAHLTVRVRQKREEGDHY